MDTVRLDERLSAIYLEIPAGGVVADIGTDHGKLAVRLASDGFKVIASDVSAASLAKARRLARENGAEKSIDFRVGDGLNVLADGEADTVVISGMGGREIIKIIADKRIPLYVLGAQRDQPLLRRYLISVNRTILSDKTVKCAGRYYSVIASGLGVDRTLSELEIEFGKDFYDDPLFKERAEKEIKRLTRMYDTLLPENTWGRQAAAAETEKYREALKACRLQ
ncbi:MAG: class I SAM-dependent methyltransferase [Clostridiaceae bacterium]|jgi:tRNA (adenine22-N1)-methyltransferase|nr:class I SAM-dependent methyltransferase [Clostridiaceae bacterium]